jgi:hypothetical protein
MPSNVSSQTEDEIERCERSLKGVSQVTVQPLLRFDAIPSLPPPKFVVLFIFSLISTLE